MMQKYHILTSFLATRAALAYDGCRLKNRRKKLWRGLQSPILKTPALAPYHGMPLESYPVTNAGDIRADLTAWNSAGITHARAHAAAADAESGGRGEIMSGISAGYSTGTSGTKGVFIASSRERALYAGMSAAKLLPISALSGGARVLLFLRANSRLYSDSQKSSFVEFCYRPLSLDASEKIEAIKAFRPSILIAPAHVWLELARAGFTDKILSRAYYGAEPMGDHEKKWISEVIGISPQPIYQATEGFLGFSCGKGRLHLNEDCMEFEFALAAGTMGGQLIVTDLLRHTQPIIRIKLDDYIEFDPAGCICGFAGRVIRPVAGRVQDLWRFDHAVITPSTLTQVLEASLGPYSKWKASASRAGVVLAVEKTVTGAQAKFAAQELGKTIGFCCPIRIEALDEKDIAPKRKRISWRECDET